MKTNLQPVSKAAVPRVTRTQIVCGDCAGDRLVPERTFLMADGRCSRCGGRNYVLASILCAALAHHLTQNGEKRPS